MRQRIDITEVEAETKIRAKYLRALENEEWGAAARARRSSRASCARTPSTSGSTAAAASRSTSSRYERPADARPSRRSRPREQRPPRQRGGARRPAGRPPRCWIALGARRASCCSPRCSCSGTRRRRRQRRDRPPTRRAGRRRRRRHDARRQPATSKPQDAARRGRDVARAADRPDRPASTSACSDAGGRRLLDGVDAAAGRRDADLPLAQVPADARQRRRAAASSTASLRAVPAREPGIGYAITPTAVTRLRRRPSARAAR